jgi:mono/diheme cytochrome c family protein
LGIDKKMKDKEKIAQIARTITLVCSIVVVGLLISACQSNISLKKVSLPSDSNPLIDEKSAGEDFAYPTKDPSIVEGKKFYAANCASCHSFTKEPNKHEFTVSYINKVTPSHLFKTITSNPKHPSFKENLSIKERWDIVMYLRSELFGLPEDFEKVKTEFGANCAVCHGTRGFADGNIHYYLNPKPANFNQFDRLYEKTDEKIFDEISNGIPWTAMPPWAGREDKQKHYEFDDKFRWQLVKYVRQFGYSTEADVLRKDEYFKQSDESDYKKK